MRNGAAKASKFGNRIKCLKNRGDVVIEAADRFRTRRVEADEERAAQAFVPVWMQIQSGDRSPPRTSVRQVGDRAPTVDSVRVLRPKVKLDGRYVFILAKDEVVLDENGVRCVPFTVLPVPRDPDDDLRYLTPYILRGWSCVLFSNPDDPDLPCALQKHDDPYRTFETALEALSPEDRAVYRRASGYKLYHFVPDPLG